MSAGVSDPVAAARERADAARARLIASATATQARLAPSRLAQDALDGVTERATAAALRGARAARRRPLAIAGVAAAIGLFVARGWIGRRRRRDTEADADETPPGAAGLDSDATWMKGSSK